LGRKGEAVAINVGEHDALGAEGSSQADVKATNRASAHHQDGVAFAHVNEALGVQYTGKGLGNGGFIKAQVPGNLVDAVGFEHGGWDHHFFGKTTGELVTHRGLVDANSLLAGFTGPTFFAGDRSDDLDPVSDRETGGVGADLNNLTGYFMADDLRGVKSRVTVVKNFGVGATRGAGLDPYLELVGSGLRVSTSITSRFPGLVNMAALTD